MTTIAKTQRYKELHYRLLKLTQLYSVLSEMKLHLNQRVDPKTSHYYLNKLYTWSDYGSFLTASTESMTQVFYIELDGFIGGFWNNKTSKVQLRKYESGSLGHYLYDETQTKRKMSAQLAFEKLLQEKSVELNMIYELRGKLAHFTKLKERNSAYSPSDIDTREIINRLAEIIYFLGFQKWNTPSYIELDSNFTESTHKVIDALVQPDEEAESMRELYKAKRKEWFVSLNKPDIESGLPPEDTK